MAATLPDEALTKLGEPARLLRDCCHTAGVKARWSRPEGWHVTLKFLGSVAPEQVPPVQAALEQVARAHAPFVLQFAGLGVFPTPRRPKVLWVGVTEDDGRQACVALAGDLERALAPLGFPPEERPFSPHLTMARIATPRPLPELEPLLSQRERYVEVEVDRLVLMQSEPQPRGSRYTPISTHTLVGPVMR